MNNAPAASGPAYSWYVLGVLCAVTVLNYVDRYVLAILVEPIKQDLRLTDTQIGWLVGFAFSALYAVAGVPIARLADKGSRKTVITLSIAVWSAMTAISGAAQNFWQFLICRVGVGIGEAGAIPASQSIIASLFPLNRRSTAMSVLTIGGSIGLMIAFSAGAALDRAFGWRWTFVLVAIPGPILAALLWATISEPRSVQGDQEQLSFGQTLKAVWSNKVFQALPFAHAMMALLLFGQTQWMPAFIERTFGESRASIGGALAIAQGAGGILGMLCAGLLADRLSRFSPAWIARLPLICLLLAAAPMAALYTQTEIRFVYPLIGVMTFLLSAPSAPIFTLIQSSVAPHMRATASAISAMIAALIGLGLGPLLIGMMSDHFASQHGAQGLQKAMLIISMSAVALSVLPLWRIQSALRHERLS